MKRLITLTAVLLGLSVLSGCSGEVKYSSPEAALSAQSAALTSGDVKGFCQHAIKEDRTGCETDYAEFVSLNKENLGDDWGVVKDQLSLTYYNDELDVIVENIVFGNGYRAGGIHMEKQAGTWRVSLSETY